MMSTQGHSSCAWVVPAVDHKMHAVLEREQIPLIPRKTGQITHAWRSQREEGIHVRASPYAPAAARPCMP